LPAAASIMTRFAFILAFFCHQSVADLENSGYVVPD